MVRANGQIRHVHETAEPIFDDTGQRVRTVGILQDVTDAIQRDANLKLNAGRLKESARIAKLGR